MTSRPPASPPKSRTRAANVVPREPLAREIARIIRERRLTQAAAARLVNDAPWQLSVLLRGSTESFSTERLLRMLTLLGSNVDIVLSRTPDGGKGSVRVRRR
jgi:predicted XRE-type DNA-binding protein